MEFFFRFPETSDFLSLLKKLKTKKAGLAPFRDVSLRVLSEKEISRLEAQGNTAEDWKKVLVVEDFLPDGIRHAAFFGSCILGRFAGKNRLLDSALPSGIYSSTLVDAVVGDDALVHRSDLAANYFIDSGASVSGSVLTHRGDRAFGNGLRVDAGIETGGRSFYSYFDLSPEAAEAMARKDLVNREDLEAGMKAYVEAATLPFGYLGPGTEVFGAKKIENSFLAGAVRVDGTDLISGSTVVGTQEDPVSIGRGVIIEDSVLRPGSEVESQAVVRRCFFADHAGAEVQGKVTDCYIGSNSKVGEGEVTSSFVGPFVGFHHQSLLIAAFWPSGRGNIGQGANVGSNHTSRTPDQEIWPGEGMFFGLGCNIKYPADFSRSPYTIIATGVSTLPQKTEYPFSLIAQPEELLPGVPPAYNRLVPAWGLKENLYALRRNEEKFLKRNKAKNLVFDADPLRPDITELLRLAAERLAAPDESKLIYLPGDIPGLGKNYLLEADRVTAVETYEFYIRFACLKNLASRPELFPLPRRKGEPILAPLLETPTEDPKFEYFRKLMLETGWGAEPLKAVLEEYLADLNVVSVRVLDARGKDYRRGVNVIDDYAETHLPPERDEFVLSTQAWVRRETERLRKGLAAL